MFTGVDRMNRSRVSRLAVPCLAVFLLLSLPLTSSAQSASARGVISGTITDQQGGSCARREGHVFAAPTSPPRVRCVTTSETGRFTAAMLNPGVYTIEVKAPGFALKKPARVTLGVGSTVQLTIQLGIAGTSQNVTVSGHGPTRGRQHAAARGEQGNAAGQQHAGRADRHLPP